MANYVFQLLLALVAISDYRLTHKKKNCRGGGHLGLQIDTHKKTNCAEDYLQNNSGMVQ